MRASAVPILTVALIIVGALSLLESYENLTYALKAGVKIVLFLLIPLALSVYFIKGPLLGIKKVRASDLIPGFVLGTIAMLGVFLGYVLFGSMIDFAAILAELDTKLGVNASNFVYIALYVTIVNSLLEEVFFRGFVFLNLRKSAPRLFAYVFSAGLFALYHVAIIGTWFNPWLMALALGTLFAVGMIFNLVNERSGHFLNSWIAHAMADLAIVLIGFHLFGFF